MINPWLYLPCPNASVRYMKTMKATFMVILIDIVLSSKVVRQLRAIRDFLPYFMYNLSILWTPVNSKHLLEFPTGWDFLVPRDKGTTVQKSLHCSGTKEQWDKLKILPRNGPWPYFDILPWDGILTAFFAAALVKGTAGQGNFFLSRDKGTAGKGNFFCPRTKGHLETLVHTYNNDVIMIIDK